MSNCEDKIINNFLITNICQFSLDNGDTITFEAEIGCDLINCENDYKILYGKIKQNNSYIGAITISFKENEMLYNHNPNIGKILYINNIAIDNTQNRGKGLTKKLHLLFDEFFKDILIQSHLNAKADGLIVWLKLNYECVNNQDMVKIKDRLAKYLEDKKIGKGLNKQQSRYILNKKFAQIQKKHLKAEENTKQIDFLDFYIEEENKTNNLNLDGIDPSLLVGLKNLIDMVPMYKEIGA